MSLYSLSLLLIYLYEEILHDEFHVGCERNGMNMCYRVEHNVISIIKLLWGLLARLIAMEFFLHSVSEKLTSISLSKAEAKYNVLTSFFT